MRDLTSSEKFILCGAGATALLAFFPWISVSMGNNEMGEIFKQFGAAAGGPSGNGFSSGWGVGAFLAAVATCVLVAADRSGMLPWQPPARLLAPLASSGLALLCLLVVFGRVSSASTPMVSVGRSMWFYLALVAMGFATFHAFQRWSEGSKSDANQQSGV
ncbi:MAG: hypothetical protein R3F56_13935 [Planctomycetota bacterium]